MSGAKFLVVEDEAIIAMSTEDMLIALGHDPAFTAENLERALEIVAAGGFDAALLDINLNGVESGPVADALAERGIPLIFTTGYGEIRVPEGHQAATVLEKPYTARDLENAIAGLGL
ncbi:response regulator [Parasphingopyxis marina]|uniref:Response regulator n=1 Tax=Parasphingopyxis marina TaxID=2761622 RepID=A0A842HW17_9SPHN|nr:response regulator [Parasphingopyxis marina]MBC2776551.1 response regulator [Parasphingopyxis marina]